MLSLGLLLGLLFLFCLAGGKFYVPLLVFSCLLGIIPLCYYWAYKKSFVIVLGLGIATALCMAAEIVVTTLLLSFIAKLL